MREFSPPAAAQEPSVETDGRAAADRAREPTQPGASAVVNAEWAAVVAHDLRQPLNNLNLWLGVLERQATRAGCVLTEGFEHARAGVKQLDRMITDLVEASRLRANPLTLKRSPTDLPALVRRVVERADVDLRARARFEPSEPVRLIEVDPGRLEQALVNLLMSSARYADPGSPLVIEVSEGKHGVRVAVTSHGPGLPAREAERLAGSSTEMPGGTAGEVSGMSLGLYVARALIEAHGGRLSVEGSTGHNTALHFTLARAEPARRNHQR